LPEPPLTATTALADRITVHYPDGPHDAEALIVHPVTGTLSIITKELSGEFTVFTFAKPPAGASEAALERATRLRFADVVTGAAISPDGSSIVLRTYFSVDEFRSTGADVAAAFATAPCPLPPPFEGQGEAITYTRDGTATVTVSEGKYPPVNITR
jgi:hypothetical protein